MIYCDEPHKTSGGQWWCPFSREWVARSSGAAKRCEQLTCDEIDAAIYRFENGMNFKLPPGDFLSYDQDARGLPIGYGNDGGRKVSCDIYDYDSIPDVVVTNGIEDWPLRIWEPVLKA